MLQAVTPSATVPLAVLTLQQLIVIVDSPDFWFRKISPLVSKTMHAPTGVPVAKCVVSVIFILYRYVCFLVPCTCPVSMLLFSQQFKPVTS